MGIVYRCAVIATVSWAAGSAMALGAAPPPLGPPTPAGSWSGQVTRPVTVRAAPMMAADARTVLHPHAPLGGGPTVVQVLRVSERPDGTWVQVRLAMRPNGSRGWVPVGALRLRRTTLSLTVDLSERRLALRRAGRVILRAPVGIGAPGTPTPTGRFAVAEVIRLRTSEFLGPVVLPITGFSTTLNEYAGGNGRVAMHGTDRPDLIGGPVSHGCIRLRNPDVLRLTRLVRPGTPIQIRR